MKTLKLILLSLLLCLPLFTQAAPITSYPADTTPLAGTEEMPCDQAGTTKKCSTGSIATASNGLTKTANNIALGGTLMGDTMIDVGNFGYQWSFDTVDATVENSGTNYFINASAIDAGYLEQLFSGNSGKANGDRSGFALDAYTTNDGNPGAVFSTFIDQVVGTVTKVASTLLNNSGALLKYDYTDWGTPSNNHTASINVLGDATGAYADVSALIRLPVTNTTGGTTGAQTINKQSFTVNLAASASSLDVTNSLVTANSIVLCSIMSNDTTAALKNVAITSGHAIIHTTAAVTAETRVGCVVLNN